MCLADRVEQNRPLASINVRKFNRGAGFRSAATVLPTDALRGKDHVILYIHGYNNSTRQSEQSYDSFRSRLWDLGDIQQIGVFWPGESMPKMISENTDPSPVAQFISLPTYTIQVSNSTKSAEMIFSRILEEVKHRHASFLYGKKPLKKLKISVVAHSLGCRVALGILSRFVGTMKSQLQFPLVALMAAAVPTNLVMRNGFLRPGLEYPDDVIVYSSSEDEALGVAFRLFQLPHLPMKDIFRKGSLDALGLLGTEASQNLHRRHANRKHGDYWRSIEISDEVASAIKNGKVPRDAERKLSISERYVRG